MPDTPPPAPPPRPAPDPASAPTPTTTLSPKRRRDEGLAWLVLLGLLLLGVLPLVIELGRPALWTGAEALAVAVSAETRDRKTPLDAGEATLRGWTPVYRGTSRWDLPPGGVWLHLMMYAGAEPALDEQSAPLVTRARLGSVLMALLMIAAVFWAGHSIGGVSTGAMSALVAMTMPVLIYFGRLATADTAAIAWSTLSIAGGLWAMRPLRASPAITRQAMGWLVCGIALGLAVLTAGPRAAPATLACTVVLAMCCPRRVGHLLGLFASTAVALLVVTPWALHVHDHDPAVWRSWLDELTPALARGDVWPALHQAGWRLSLSATACGLWLVWLIPALAQPFSTSTGSARRRMMLGFGWLVTASLLIALAPGPTRLSGLLLAVAPASVAIGLVMQQFHDLSAEGRHARLWLVCRWIAGALTVLLAVAMPAMAYLISHRPDPVPFLPTLEQPVLAPQHPMFYLGAGAALLLTALLGIRFMLGHHPGRTLACHAVWLSIAMSLAAIPVTRSDQLSTPAHPPTLASPGTAHDQA